MSNLGINALMQNKVDANRAQPGRLAQSWQTNHQLIDLLALQKLTTEKEAAVRQMQLDAARKTGSPQPTVAEQRQDQALNLTKQQISQQSAIGGQQIQAQQQAAQQGGDAMPAGIASQAAPNMAGMAKGGIVGFAEGGHTYDPNNLTEADRIADKHKQGEMARANLWKVLESLGVKSADDVNKEDADRKLAGLKAEAEGDLSSPGSAIPTPQPTMDLLQAPGQPQESTPMAAPSRIQDADFAAPEPTGISAVLPKAKEHVVSPLETTLSDTATKQMGRDSAAEGAAAADRVKSRMSDPDLEAKRQAIQDKLEAYYAQQNDPTKLRRERLQSFLLGAGGRSGIGSVLGGGAAAATQTEKAQEAAQVSQMQEAAKYYNDRVTELRNMGVEQTKAEQQARTDTEAAIRTGMTTGADVAGQANNREIEANREQNAVGIEQMRNKSAMDVAKLDVGSRQKIAEMETNMRKAVASEETRRDLEKLARQEGAKSVEDYRKFMGELTIKASQDMMLQSAIAAHPELSDKLLSDWISKRATIYDVHTAPIKRVK